MTLKLYSFFHLNLAYSAIEQESRAQVIKNCYWPLLELAKNKNLPFGIELSGFTLESILKIDPEWVDELAQLVNEGPCELIGSGYSQIIGPLVPHQVTSANLKIGNSVYKRLLGVQPLTALLNEQAFSSGLVNLYRNAGYENVIMEWNNPAKEHPEWNQEWRYFAQRAKATHSGEINLIWNKSISFQKFQRYAHGEIELQDILKYVKGHQSTSVRAFPLYGNDVEIFDFRPGRYMTETRIQQEGEWDRINKLYSVLELESDIEFILPSEVLKISNLPESRNLLNLSSAPQPIPVKKQDKYNIVRWAVTGRDDLDINTRCWRLFTKIAESRLSTDDDWKELCYLWSSDFRTHITEKRWGEYLERLNTFEKKWSTDDKNLGTKLETASKSIENPGKIKVERFGNILKITGERLIVNLNCMRGLSLESFIDVTISDKRLFGTLQHGYFDNIRWGADFYSGHLVFESPGQHKITDLVPIEPEISHTRNELRISGNIQTFMGPIEKVWVLDDKNGSIKLFFRFNWPKAVVGSLRLGNITLIPESFDTQSLNYETQNGGTEMEKFQLSSDFDHGKPVSFLVSANQALGMTSGSVKIGDNRYGILLKCDMNKVALVGLVTHQKIQDSHLTRLAFSAREMDDTSKPSPIGLLNVELEFSAFQRDTSK
jgi:hypothetical protein